MDARREEVSVLLATIAGQTETPAADALAPLVYDELRAIAHRYMRAERAGHTLEPTAVVHEAYLRLVDETRIDWQGRTHFRAVCAKVMRRVLIDYARARSSARRGGGAQQILLDSSVAPLSTTALDAVELDDALNRLTTLDARQARVVELRFFGGMSIDDVAATLGLSKRTVEGEWTHAKAWLRAELASEAGP